MAKKINQILFDTVIEQDYDKVRKILKIKEPEWAELTNNFGDSPFGLALKTNDIRIVRLFIKAGIKLPNNFSKFVGSLEDAVKSVAVKYQRTKLGKYADLLGDL